MVTGPIFWKYLDCDDGKATCIAKPIVVFSTLRHFVAAPVDEQWKD